MTPRRTRGRRQRGSWSVLLPPRAVINGALVAVTEALYRMSTSVGPLPATEKTGQCPTTTHHDSSAHLAAASVW
jgi:hypothetical protein